MHEVIAQFGPDRGLVGVITEPPADAPVLEDLGVVLLNSGWVHRVGPHRMNVRLARELAAAGFVAARFDLSGIGDSEPRRDGLPLEESAIAETRDLMDHLSRMYGLDGFVLAGNCSGASIAYRTALADPRVAGAVLINISIFDTGQETNAYLTQKSLSDYYIQRAVRDPQRWRKLFTGKTSYRRLARSLWFRLRNLFGSEEEVESAGERIASEVEGLLERGTRLLFVISQGDASEAQIEMLIEERRPGLVGSEAARKVVIPRSDHLFTPASTQAALDRTVSEWVRGLGRRPAAGDPADGDAADGDAAEGGSADREGPDAAAVAAGGGRP